MALSTDRPTRIVRITAIATGGILYLELIFRQERSVDRSNDPP